jgi:serine/threonine protein phosphatase PrpC
VQMLVDKGTLTAEEARGHPRRSVITQAVQGDTYRAATALLPVEPGDRVLLCSDGLSDYVEDAVIGRTLREVSDLDGCAKELVSLALAAGTFDNVTVVVADVLTA